MIDQKLNIIKFCTIDNVFKTHFEQRKIVMQWYKNKTLFN